MAFVLVCFILGKVLQSVCNFVKFVVRDVSCFSCVILMNEHVDDHGGL